MPRIADGFVAYIRETYHTSTGWHDGDECVIRSMNGDRYAIADDTGNRMRDGVPARFIIDADVPRPVGIDIAGTVQRLLVIDYCLKNLRQVQVENRSRAENEYQVYEAIQRRFNISAQQANDYVIKILNQIVAATR